MICRPSGHRLIIRRHLILRRNYYVKKSLAEELSSTTYPGRGIVIGKTPDGKKAAIAYFIMGRSENSRNRIFVKDGEGIRTEAFDPSKLEDPSLIIYAPVRVLGNKTIVTNGDQTDTIYDLMDKQYTLNRLSERENLNLMRLTTLLEFQVYFILTTVHLTMPCLF